jgi:ABC-type antimicrobial peptide transport system ATPase subunit|tara:strand:- start:4681 stop:4857 length:177 start_codon:yes stop_codon:yes gene_type:complete
MDLNKKEAEAILSIAKKIIVAIEKNNNKIVRSTEDRLDHDDIDLTGVRAPEKCKECND